MSRGRALLIALLQRTSAREVAARCRVAPPRVSEWVAGASKPSVSAGTAAILAEAYGIPIDSW